MGVSGIEVTAHFISGGVKYYLCTHGGATKAVAEEDAVSSGILPSELFRVPEADAECFLLDGDEELPVYLIPDKRFVLSTGGSSKGYAKKVMASGFWYKLSVGAFNAQAEVVASRLAKYTNVGESVSYEMRVVNGEYATRSKDFLSGVQEVETVKSIHAKVTGTPIEAMLGALSGHELFLYVADIVRRGIGYDLTSLPAVRQLSLLLQFDALVLNEDRHFNNIKFIKQGACNWVLAPAFDFDCSLFSCVENLGDIKNYTKPSLPFYRTHPEQLDWLYSLSGTRLTLFPFSITGLLQGVWDSTHTIGKREIDAYFQTILVTGGISKQ
jgi:hypothetical protein